MVRAVCVATFLLMAPPAAFAQVSSVLHITVTLADASGKLTPVARHALLISEEPPTAAPRRTFTTLAGTADVTLKPGRYAVESDQPVAFEGKTYEWSQRIEVVAGRATTLALTADNASIESGSAGISASPSDTDPSFLVAQWQNTVVALWTPTRYASGFLVDARGLIVTNQRVIGTATSAEVQLSPEIKVRATVVASDQTRDVAFLRVNPEVVASVRPLSLGCGTTRPAVANGQELYTIGAQMTGGKRLTLGDVTGVGPRLLLSDLTVMRASAGGPVFTAGGLVGLTSVDDRDADGRTNARVVRIDQACEVLASAEQKIAAEMPPDATHLPLDPRTPVAVSALAEAVKSRAGSLNPYPLNTINFDVAFITPVHLYGLKDQVRRPVMDFANWASYLADYPRVLLVRATPKVVEGLWAKVARGAAMTQGMALPPMKRAKASFASMRAFCGDTEVLPIHPFMVERRVSETEALYEGLYVFDPAAFGPQCGGVKLVFYSEDAPAQGDTRIIDPKVLQQIQRDFAPL